MSNQKFIFALLLIASGISAQYQKGNKFAETAVLSRFSAGFGRVVIRKIT